MENNTVQNTYVKLDIAVQNIRYIAPRIFSNLNRDSLALDPIKYLGNPLGYTADIIGGLFIDFIIKANNLPDRHLRLHA